MVKIERRAVPRAGLRVLHRHRVGRRTLHRISELVFLGGEPKAVLEWINMAGDRSPVYVDMDVRRLRKLQGARHCYVYEGETVDPRVASLPGEYR